MGKSSSPPPTPDYVGAAKEQGQQNLVSAQQSAVLSNPNMYTPFGTQKVTFSDPVFDESGYNAALADYNRKIDRNNFYDNYQSPYMAAGEGPGYSGGEMYSQFNNEAYRDAVAAAGAAPDRNAYMKGGGVPTVTQTLTPEAQATLDAQMRVQRAMAGLSETGIGNAREMLGAPFQPTNNSPLRTDIDTSGLVDMPINAGTTAQDLILQRLQPTIEQGDTSFKQALANQGLAPGTEAYNAAFRNREMSKNDLYSQAALQGIGLDMNARQQGYSEQMGRAGLYNQALSQQLAQDLTLRGQPMNEIIGLLGGSQIQLPQFAGYQGTSIAPAPTFAATQAANQAAMQNYGIQQAGANSTMQGIGSLALAAAMY
jgi:hypothetical protein